MPSSIGSGIGSGMTYLDDDVSVLVHAGAGAGRHERRRAVLGDDCGAGEYVTRAQQVAVVDGGLHSTALENNASPPQDGTRAVSTAHGLLRQVDRPGFSGESKAHVHDLDGPRLVGVSVALAMGLVK